MAIWGRRRSRTSPRARVYTAPPGLRIYAIGDIHGRADLLNTMLASIAADLGTRPSQALLIALGDYVDRGPHSRSVIERLASGTLPARLLALRGNHEDMLLNFLAEPATLGEWRRNGGLETLHAYGVDVSHAMRGEGYEAARDAFKAALPASHLQFLSALPSWRTVGDYFFCHAGIRPDAPLSAQKDEDLLWIRAPFLNDASARDKIVVHGHTPVAEPDVRANRINIDTGAFATSKLTCLVLEGTRRDFLFASSG